MFLKFCLVGLLLVGPSTFASENEQKFCAPEETRTSRYSTEAVGACVDCDNREARQIREPLDAKPILVAAQAELDRVQREQTFLQAFEQNQGRPHNANLEQLEKMHEDRVAQILNRASSKIPVCGMTPAEIIGLRHYLGGAHRDLNVALTGEREPAPELKAHRNILNSALQKLNPHEGEVYYSKVDLSETEIADLQEGKVFRKKDFTSTSPRKLPHSKYNFTLRSRSGRVVTPYSDVEVKGEQEVLIQAGAQFRVVSREVKGDSVSYVLEEVEEPSAR